LGAQLEPTIFDKRFVAKKRIGGGSLAEVLRGIDLQDSSEVVIKVFSRAQEASDHEREAFRRELLALRALQHPNVVRIRADGMLPEDRPFIVLKWAGSLCRVCLQSSRINGLSFSTPWASQFCMP